MNSYLGIFKTRNGYALARRIIDTINPEWWRYCCFDLQRVAILPKEGYAANDILDKRFHFKKRKYDKRRTGKRYQCA